MPEPLSEAEWDAWQRAIVASLIQRLAESQVEATPSKQIPKGYDVRRPGCAVPARLDVYTFDGPYDPIRKRRPQILRFGFEGVRVLGASAIAARNFEVSGPHAVNAKWWQSIVTHAEKCVEAAVRSAEAE